MRATAVWCLFGFLFCASGCKSETVAIGGECSSRDDCVGREDCLKLPSGKGVCTKSCSMPVVMGPPGTPPTADECPAPTKCTMINMSVDVPGKTVDVPKIPRCMPPGVN